MRSGWRRDAAARADQHRHATVAPGHRAAFAELPAHAFPLRLVAAAWAGGDLIAGVGALRRAVGLARLGGPEHAQTVPCV